MIFSGRCAECHQPDGRRQTLGPDLTGARTQSKDKLLTAILEPHAEITPGFGTWAMVTKDGDNCLGTKAEDNLLTLTLHSPQGGRSIWPRLNVQSLQPLAWSLMPEGLEQGLSAQDMADLLEYLAGSRL